MLGEKKGNEISTKKNYDEHMIMTYRTNSDDFYCESIQALICINNKKQFSKVHFDYRQILFSTI